MVKQFFVKIPCTVEVEVAGENMTAQRARDIAKGYAENMDADAIGANHHIHGASFDVDFAGITVGQRPAK